MLQNIDKDEFFCIEPGNNEEILEGKDIYTYRYGDGVKDHSMAISKKLDLSKERLQVLGYAALCHNVGKINVPDEILNKPGRLTDEEMNYIKMHPQDGATMVNGTFFKTANKIIKQHHERLDGSGYPLWFKR